MNFNVACVVLENPYLYLWNNRVQIVKPWKIPSGSGADAAGHCTAACILGIHCDAIFLALSQGVLYALFDLALVCFAGGDTLYTHWATWHFLAAIFYVDLVAAAVVRQIGRFVFAVTEILQLHSAWNLIRSLFKKILIAMRKWPKIYKKIYKFQAWWISVAYHYF